MLDAHITKSASTITPRPHAFTNSVYAQARRLWWGYWRQILRTYTYTHTRKHTTHTGKNALRSAGVAYTLIELDECGENRNGEVQQVYAHTHNKCLQTHKQCNVLPEV